MSDGLITPYNKDVAMESPGLEGDLITARGGDPNIDTGGSSGLKAVWASPTVGDYGPKETANSVSGLPSLPNRWVPSDNPPQPPDLTDRTPGTIDER